MLHTLGGRFLKRVVPQDANSVPLDELDPLPTVDEAESAGEFSRQTLPEANRRVRTSAAMLGLAISVGAYGLVAPRQGDAAVAAEPTTTDPASNAANSAPEPPSAVEVATTPSAASVSTTTYTVQEGQTLWKIAELYGIDATKLANLNGLPPNSVLYVGQTIQVPAGDQTVAAIRGVALKSLPDLKTIPAIPAEPTTVPSSDALQLQQSSSGERKTALDDLKQNRERLKQRLAELKSEGASKSVQVAAVPAGLNPANFVRYQVNPGDTLSSIASSHGISVRELAQINRLDNPNLVKANQQIQVPQVVAQLPEQEPQPPAAETVTPVADAGVQVPTVPSLAVTQNATSETLPLAVGGNAQQLAFSPNRSNRIAPDAQRSLDVRAGSEQYVSNLMSEIAKLRQRYQSSSSNSQRNSATTRSVTRASASSPSLFNGSTRRVNPEFKRRQAAAPRQGASASQPTVPQTRLERMLADAPRPRTQVVAAAPLGSESYKPILRSPVGKTVAPNLPPLGGSESYLPGAQFKGYVWPAKGVLTSGYGWRWGRMHKGIDIAAPVGTPIIASAPGRVVTAGWNDGGYGYLVEVEHADGSVTLYAHNSRILVRVGQQVRQGQQIALMGSTGFSTGPHSHFEVHLPGRGAVNPIALLPQSRS